jgi:hypothetical protein
MAYMHQYLYRLQRALQHLLPKRRARAYADVRVREYLTDSEIEFLRKHDPEDMSPSAITLLDVLDQLKWLAELEAAPHDHKSTQNLY